MAYSHNEMELSLMAHLNLNEHQILKSIALKSKLL